VIAFPARSHHSADCLRCCRAPVRGSVPAKCPGPPPSLLPCTLTCTA
jgi:hypothetical protein